MIKKSVQSLVIAIGVTTGATALADNMGFACSGFYGGISGGVMQTGAKMTASPSVMFTNLYDTQNQLSSAQEVNAWKNAGVGAVYLGYRQRMNGSNFFMAGELFGNTAKRRVGLNNFVYHNEPNDDSDSESLNTITQVKLNDDEFGVDLQPGYLFDTHTLFYGRVGAGFNKLKIMSQDNFSFISTYLLPGTYDSSLGMSKTKDVTAVRLGIGLEHNVGNNVSVTADYIYTNYGKVSANGVADAATIIGGGDDSIFGPIPDDSSPDSLYATEGGLAGKASARLATQALMLGLKYTFAAV